jgi:hypothetical protein
MFMMLVLVFFVFSSPVLAEENSIDQKRTVKIDKLSLEEFAAKYWAPWGMDKATQQKLINKIKKGEILDANRPEMQSKAKIETFMQVNDEGVLEEVTKLTYPDGSISVTTKEIPNEGSGATGDVGALAVDTSTGKVSCGTGYCNFYNVKVSHLSGFVYAKFYADFTIVHGYYDYISRVYDYSIIMVPGSFSVTSFRINKAQESLSGPAYATLEWIGSLPGDIFSATFRLRLYVGNDKYYSWANY